MQWSGCWGGSSSCGGTDFYVRRGSLISLFFTAARRSLVQSAEFGGLPEQGFIDRGGMTVHLFLRLSVLPEQAQTVKDLPDTASL